MNLLNRLLLYLLLALGAARMLLYFGYASAMLTLPLESHNLEAKMVLLAYRAEHGLELYPAWWDYPYVANWFGPINALLVGNIGRLLHADIRGLFLIGRTVSFASSLLTTVVVALAVDRRYGRGAGLAAAVLSLGNGPMFGFTVMVRPDALAELLGVTGFFLCGGRARATRAAGVLMLVLAILTKQTAGVFLLAAAIAAALTRGWRQALFLLAAAAALLGLVVLAVTLGREPNFARALVGERVMPWSYANWLVILRRIVISCTDLLVLPAIGLWLWLGDRSRPREVEPAALALVLLAAALGLSGKIGSDMNYYLSLRVVEAMAAGTLWHTVHTTANATGAEGRRRTAAPGAAILATIVSLIPSLITALTYFHMATVESTFYDTPNGRLLLKSYQKAIALARDPRVHLLTDSGLIDLYQGERAAFGDPWLFRTLVETGRLQPTVMARRIDSQYYDVFISTHDFTSPRYVNHDFRLPRGLIERVAARYVLDPPSPPGLQFHVRRRRP
jgi:hypothetical protein